MLDKKPINRTASRAKSGSRPPSLKELSERLTTSSSSSALSEITSSTNLPSSDSRLKLPPSAVARANLTPSPPPRTAKNDENTRVDVDTGAKDTKEDDKSGDGKSDTGKTLSRHSSTATLKNSEAGDEASDGTRATNSLALSIGGESEPSPTPTPSKPTKTDGTATDETKSGVYKPKQLDELRHNKARASLGHGFPGFGLGPETPSRLKEEVPSIIVQRSTPGQSPGKEVEEGTRSGRASPSMPPSPRSLANGLPLEHAWTLLYDSKTYKPPPEVFEERRKHVGDWEASMLPVGTFDTIQSFCRHMNNIRQPSKLVNGASYHMFKDGIRPSWEDPANTNGGKWVLFVKSKDGNIDTCWSNLVLALVGEMLDPDDHVTGIVVSSRPKMDRIQIWTRIKDDVAAVDAIGHRILETIGLEPHDMQTSISLEFNAHKETVTAGKYMRVSFIQRSASISTSVPSGVESPRRSSARIGPGSSPVGTPSPLSPWTSTPSSPLTPSSPRQASSTLPSSRGRVGGMGGNAFSGPLGSARRLFSTQGE